MKIDWGRVLDPDAEEEHAGFMIKDMNTEHARFEESLFDEVLKPYQDELNATARRTKADGRVQPGDSLEAKLLIHRGE